MTGDEGVRRTLRMKRKDSTTTTTTTPAPPPRVRVGAVVGSSEAPRRQVLGLCDAPNNKRVKGTRAAAARGGSVAKDTGRKRDSVPNAKTTTVQPQRPQTVRASTKALGKGAAPSLTSSVSHITVGTASNCDSELTDLGSITTSDSDWDDADLVSTQELLLKIQRKESMMSAQRTDDDDDDLEAFMKPHRTPTARKRRKDSTAAYNTDDTVKKKKRRRRRKAATTATPTVNPDVGTFKVPESHLETLEELSGTGMHLWEEVLTRLKSRGPYFPARVMGYNAKEKLFDLMVLDGVNERHYRKNRNQILKAGDNNFTRCKLGDFPRVRVDEGYTDPRLTAHMDAVIPELLAELASDGPPRRLELFRANRTCELAGMFHSGFQILSRDQILLIERRVEEDLKPRALKFLSPRLFGANKVRVEDDDEDEDAARERETREAKLVRWVLDAELFERVRDLMLKDEGGKVVLPQGEWVERLLTLRDSLRLAEPIQER